MSSDVPLQFLFSESGDDIFLLRCDPNEQVPSADLMADFSIRVANRTGLFTFKWLLSGSRAFFCKPGVREPSGTMNLLNSYMELIPSFEENNTTYYGLRFSKKSAYEELFSPDRTLVALWFEHLKRFCIRQDFSKVYTLVEQIGAGSFARVFKAERIADKRIFAAKVFEKVAKNVENTAKVIQNELNTLRAIKHHRVINFIELYESANYVYCITDLYFGPSLQKAFEGRFPVPERLALKLISQILEALSYLHSMGIVHRDLKPENVLFKESTDTLDLVVIDFGFATREFQEPLLKRCGSLGFVAPEILNDRPFDRRADIFSIGGMLHKM